MPFALDVLLPMFSKLLFSLLGEKIGGINQFPRWLLYTLIVLFVVMVALAIAVLVVQLAMLIGG
jgi:uncharacterized membrane protein YhdT